MAKRSIQSSMSLWLAVQTFFFLAVSSTVIYVVADWTLKKSQESEILRHEGMIRSLYGQAQKSGDLQELRAELTEFFRIHDELAVQLKLNGEMIFEAGPDASNDNWRQEHMPPTADAPELDLIMAVRVTADRQMLSTLAIALVLVSLAASLVASMVSARLVRRGLSPLRALAKETQEVGPHASGKRLNEEAYGTEMEPFVHQFNLLLQRAERAYQQLESFNADVAHELRTPLANLIGEAEVELGRPRNAEELREVLLSNLEEARKLSAIVSDMLFLSRADRGVIARTVQVNSLCQPTLEVVEFHEALLETKDLRIEVKGDAQVEADVGLVKRAISNLLGNAVQYARYGSRIRIDILIESDGTWIDVSNDGPDIPPETGDKIFERFYRVDRSRTGANYGLGLSIVAAIARMHGGATRSVSHHGTTTVGFSIASVQGSRAFKHRRSKVHEQPPGGGGT